MFGDSSEEESVTFSDLHQQERAKHLQLLRDIEDKLYAEDFLPSPPEPLDESDGRHFYRQLENCVDDQEIAAWRHNFPYLRVVGHKILPGSEHGERSESRGVSASVVRDTGGENYELQSEDAGDNDASEVTFAFHIEEQDLSGSPPELSPLMHELWPALVEALSPFIRSVVRRRLESNASHAIFLGQGSTGSAMSWGTQSSTSSNQRIDDS